MTNEGSMWHDGRECYTRVNIACVSFDGARENVMRSFEEKSAGSTWIIRYLHGVPFLLEKFGNHDVHCAKGWGWSIQMDMYRYIQARLNTEHVQCKSEEKVLWGGYSEWFRAWAMAKDLIQCLFQDTWNHRFTNESILGLVRSRFNVEGI